MSLSKYQNEKEGTECPHPVAPPLPPLRPGASRLRLQQQVLLPGRCAARHVQGRGCPHVRCCRCPHLRCRCRADLGCRRQRWRGALPPAIVADGGTSVLPGPFPKGVEAQYGPICKASDLGIAKFDPKTATIGWAQSEKEANPFRIQSTKSQVAEAKKRGIKLLTTNAQSNVQQENTDIKGMIDKGAKAIIFSPINSTGLGDAIAYAKSKKVAMIPVDRNITGVKACQEVGPQLGSDFVQQGKRAADAMIKATGGKANLLILLGATGVNVTDDRTKGFKDELAAKKARRDQDRR